MFSILGHHLDRFNCCNERKTHEEVTLDRIASGPRFGRLPEKEEAKPAEAPKAEAPAAAPAAPAPENKDAAAPAPENKDAAAPAAAPADPAKK